MALDLALQSRIIDLANDHWTAHVQGTAFAELISGKEPGHRMADYVDDQITSLLKVSLDTRYEANARDQPKKRSMGDVWVHSNNIFNPINVKAGLQGMKGQPNLVSMQKLLNYIFKGWIDSYYLLIIKFDNTTAITHKAYLIDLLEWTEFITYNAGPGQIMLREEKFYAAVESGHVPISELDCPEIAKHLSLHASRTAFILSSRIDDDDLSGSVRTSRVSLSSHSSSTNQH